MNVDEASNGAYVVYYVREGLSLWQAVTPLLLWVYRAAYWLGGDYNHYALRIVGSLLVWLTAVHLYAIGLKGWGEPRWAAVWAAAYVTLMISRRWEGYAVNAELLANALLTLALLSVLLVKQARRPILWAGAAGVLFGLAFQAKSQSLPLMVMLIFTMTGILWLRIGKSTDRIPLPARIRFFLRLLPGSFLAFFVPAYVMIRFQWVLTGQWRRFLTTTGVMVHRGQVSYIEGGVPQDGSKIALLIENVLWRPLPDVAWFIAYVMLLAAAVMWLRGALKRHKATSAAADQFPSRMPGKSQPPTAPWLIPVLAMWLMTALFMLSLGYRFFAHYYIFALPAVSGLAASLGRRLWTLQWNRSRSPLVGWLHPGRLVALGLAVFFVVDSVFISYLKDLQGTITFEKSLFRATAEEIIRRTNDDDRIYVWGYSPDLYLYVRLVPAARQVTPQNIVRDFGQTDRPQVQHALLEQLFNDFASHPPRLFVDVSAASFSLAELKTGRKSDVYNIALIPPLRDYLATHFNRLGAMGPVVFYEWKSVQH